MITKRLGNLAHHVRRSNKTSLIYSIRRAAEVAEIYGCLPPPFGRIGSNQFRTLPLEIGVHRPPWIVHGGKTAKRAAIIRGRWNHTNPVGLHRWRDHNGHRIRGRILVLRRDFQRSILRRERRILHLGRRLPAGRFLRRNLVLHRSRRQ